MLYKRIFDVIYNFIIIFAKNYISSYIHVDVKSIIAESHESNKAGRENALNLLVTHKIYNDERTFLNKN